MKSLFRILSVILINAIWLGIAYAVFFYLADFSRAQSVALAIVGLCAFEGFRTALATAAKRKPEFSPFWMRIQPNWFAICHDYDLAAGEAWTTLQERRDAAPVGYSILRNGFNFTMLSPTLFYSNDHQTFFGELDLKVSIEELNPEPDSILGFSPQFYIKRTVAGEKNSPVIEFGLVTRESLKKSFHPGDDHGDIPIAWMPESILYRYFHADEYDWKKMKAVDAIAKAQLAEFDWMEEKRDSDDSWLNWPYEINHKYLRVKYRGI
jgi:hypothetical protein